MELAATIRALGGIASVDQLRRRGFSPQYVRGAYRRHGLQRIRRGWYALPTADPAVTSAARAGGSLTCVSGCEFYGLWTPRKDAIHVAVPARSRHVKHPVDGSPIRGSMVGVVLHWSGPRGNETSFEPGALPLRDCLVEVLHCLPAEMAFAIIESALHRRMISVSDIAWLVDAVPSRKKLLCYARSDAESGTESLFRYRMAALGIAMRSQVAIDGVGRVDFVIGDRLIVEIDSEAHHGGHDHRRRDLDRDAVAVTLDYLPLRFDFLQVMTDWDAVASTVWAVVDRGDHLNRSQAIPKSDSDVTRRLEAQFLRRVTPNSDFRAERQRPNGNQ